MKLTIKQKMFGMGSGVLIAAGALWGLSEFASTKTHSASKAMKTANDLNGLRLRQMALINRYEYSIVQLTLAAMDSIIDKAEGAVAPERLQNMDKRAKFLTENFTALETACDTDKEKQIVQRVKGSIPQFIKAIKEDLVNAIVNSGMKVKQIEADFVKTDDVLDEQGDAIAKILETLEASLLKERETLGKAREAALTASEMNLHLIQVQQWLTDISATRGAEGYDDGFDEAETHAKEFKEKLKELLALTPEMKSDLDNLSESFDAFYSKGKWMAQRYIDKGPFEGNKAMSEFDAFAEDIGKRISTITAATSDKAAKVVNVNKGILLITNLRLAHLDLMLSAMDSIIDRNDGKIADERYEHIVKDSKMLEAAAKDLALYCPTQKEQLKNFQIWYLNLPVR